MAEYPKFGGAVHRSDTSRYQQLLDGELKIEDLDDRELQRMQLKSKDGTFRGRPSNMIPRSFATAANEELRKRITMQMQEMVPQALKSLSSIVKFGDDAAAPRLPAVKEVLERTIGKVTDRKEIETTVKMEVVQTKLAGYLIPAPQQELTAGGDQKKTTIRVRRPKIEDIVDAEIVEE